MHFFRSTAIGASVIARLTVAQSTKLAFTNVPTQVTAGQPATIQYSSDSQNVAATITLRKGNPADLDTISVLTSDATNGTYTWIPDISLANASNYALEITQGDEMNYSGEFTLTGANAAAISAAEAATSSMASAAAALTLSFSKSVAIASIQSIIASYNSSLLNLTAPMTKSTANGPAVVTTTAGSASIGTGISISRNTTMSSAGLTASPIVPAGSTAGPTTATSTTIITASSALGTSSQATGTASASASASKTGSAAGMSRSIPVALVLCIVAVLFCLQ